jgi:hypothetical protein
MSHGRVFKLGSSRVLQLRLVVGSWCGRATSKLGHA